IDPEAAVLDRIGAAAEPVAGLDQQAGHPGIGEPAGRGDAGGATADDGDFGLGTHAARGLGGSGWIDVGANGRDDTVARRRALLAELRFSAKAGCGPGAGRLSVARRAAAQ